MAPCSDVLDYQPFGGPCCLLQKSTTWTFIVVSPESVILKWM